MRWTISSFPKCTHHIFLSHVAEDRERLVWPLYERLQGNGIACWLDQHDYPSGRSSSQALRDGLLRCRHVAFLVTEAVLRQARGWCVQELTWAELIQDNFIAPGGRTLNVTLPLFFVGHGHRKLNRTVWQRFQDQGVFIPPTDPVARAAHEIDSFLRREESFARDHEHLFLEIPSAAKAYRKTPGQADRIATFLPNPLPIFQTTRTRRKRP